MTDIVYSEKVDIRILRKIKVTETLIRWSANPWETAYLLSIVSFLEPHSNALNKSHLQIS